MRCDQCLFFSHKYSECRERSPVKLKDVEMGKFPKVSADEWCGRFQTDGTIKTFEAEIGGYRNPGYIAQFGLDASERNCQRGIEAIAERKSR